MGNSQISEEIMAILQRARVNLHNIDCIIMHPNEFRKLMQEPFFIDTTHGARLPIRRGEVGTIFGLPIIVDINQKLGTISYICYNKSLEWNPSRRENINEKQS